MKPIYESFATSVSDRGIDVIDVDVDTNSEEAAKYGVRSIPLTVFVKDDKVVGRITGVATSAELLAKYQEVYQN